MAFMQSVKNFIRDEEGVVTIEYALVAAIVAIGLIVTLGKFQESIKAFLIDITERLTAMGGVVDAVVVPTLND